MEEHLVGIPLAGKVGSRYYTMLSTVVAEQLDARVLARRPLRNVEHRLVDSGRGARRNSSRELRCRRGSLNRSIRQWTWATRRGMRAASSHAYTRGGWELFK
jgi:hypothetical protein